MSSLNSMVRLFKEFTSWWLENEMSSECTLEWSELDCKVPVLPSIVVLLWQLRCSKNWRVFFFCLRSFWMLVTLLWILNEITTARNIGIVPATADTTRDQGPSKSWSRPKRTLSAQALPTAIHVSSAKTESKGYVLKQCEGCQRKGMPLFKKQYLNEGDRCVKWIFFVIHDVYI